MFTAIRKERLMQTAYCVLRKKVSEVRCRLLSTKKEDAGRAAVLEQYKKPLVVAPLLQKGKLGDEMVGLWNFGTFYSNDLNSGVFRFALELVTAALTITIYNILPVSLSPVCHLFRDPSSLELYWRWGNSVSRD